MTENAATVIDNIFSNNLQDDIISGNLLLTSSECFSQFISVNREVTDLKRLCLLFKFSNESFRDDVDPLLIVYIVYIIICYCILRFCLDMSTFDT